MSRTPFVPELPQLTPGVHLLEASDRAVGPLHALVLDHLLLEGGTAVWIDANGYGDTTHLTEVAPSTRILDRIRIARGFTAYQHATLIRDASAAITGETSLVVAPAVDALYRGDDIRGTEPEKLLVRGLSSLARYAREADVPVLTTRTNADEFSAPVARLATEVLEVETTTFGPRFRGEDFETLVYPTPGDTMQTTLAYWARVLEARQPLHETGTNRQSAPRVSP